MTTNEIAAAKTSPYKSSQRPYRGPEAGGGAATLLRLHPGPDSGQNGRYEGRGQDSRTKRTAIAAASQEQSGVAYISLRLT